MRLFVAVDPGPAVVERIRTAIALVTPTAPTAKWVKAENLHVTLAFLGQRDAADAPKIGEALQQAAAGHRPFTLCFRGAGTFGRPRRPRVLWAGCEGDVEALGALHRDVVSALQPLGYTPDRPELSAHLTLARAKDPGGDACITDCIPALRHADFGAVSIEAVHLYESHLSPHGPRYTVIASARLGGAAP